MVVERDHLAKATVDEVVRCWYPSIGPGRLTDTDLATHRVSLARCVLKAMKEIKVKATP
jgi:hypothetical protein